MIKCESNKSVKRRTVNDNEVSLESNAESILCWSLWSIVIVNYSRYLRERGNFQETRQRSLGSHQSLLSLKILVLRRFSRAL